MGVVEASRCQLALLACAIATVPWAAFAACDAPGRVLNGAATIADWHPVLSWTPVPGATAYRIKLQSRIPNGRVLAQHDAVVIEPRFVPPQPLADYRAKVTVRLSAVCGKETSTESVSWFVIDTAGACSKGQGEKRAHALKDGRLITQQESGPAPNVQSTRPLCVGARGEATYRVAAGD